MTPACRGSNPSPNLRNMVAASRSIRASARSKARTSRSAAAPTRRSNRSARPGSTAWRSAAALNARALAGIRFYPVTFTPAAGAKLGGQVCHGVLHDRHRSRSPPTGARRPRDRVGAVALYAASSSSSKMRRTCSVRRRRSNESARGRGSAVDRHVVERRTKRSGGLRGRSICCTRQASCSALRAYVPSAHLNGPIRK